METFGLIPKYTLKYIILEQYEKGNKKQESSKLESKKRCQKGILFKN